MAMKSINQKITLNVSAQDVYDALMDSKQHSEFTGAKAVIENEVGGEFSVWDGYAGGVSLELVPGKKIVQTWRASDWPEGVESKVTFVLSKKGEGTTLEFDQTGVPDEFYNDIKQGWQDYYWEPLKTYLEK